MVITRNKHRNIRRNIQLDSGGNFGNFVQVAEVHGGTVEISWNEIINEFGKSEAEDVISVFKSAHARIHDNYLQGGYPIDKHQGLVSERHHGRDWGGRSDLPLSTTKSGTTPLSTTSAASDSSVATTITLITIASCRTASFLVAATQP